LVISRVLLAEAISFTKVSMELSGLKKGWIVAPLRLKVSGAWF